VLKAIAMLRHGAAYAGLITAALIFGGCGGGSGSGSGAQASGGGSHSSSSGSQSSGSGSQSSGSGSQSSGSGSQSSSSSLPPPPPASTTLTILHSFGGQNDGVFPIGDLVLASDGNFYGLTGWQWANGGYTSIAAVPTIFQITPSGTETVLSFLSVTPHGSLFQASDGNLYFPAASSTGVGGGEILSFNLASRQVSVLYTFDAQTLNPIGLMQASDGNLYGETFDGGVNGCGTIYQLTLAGVETVLYSFTCDSTIAETGNVHLIEASDGNLYGMTYPSTGNDTVFRITKEGTYTVIYTFGTNAMDGTGPYGSLIQATDGNFYGTTSVGGANNFGTVFKVTPAGTETVLYAFGQSAVRVVGIGCQDLAGGVPTDGAYPVANLLQASDGNFYGTTNAGGANDCGSVFKLTSSGTLTTLYSFTDMTETPEGSLIQGSDGHLYGLTDTLSSPGSVYRLD
jgi:uncharacterized repeat protein (TIGR03803 family)